MQRLAFTDANRAQQNAARESKVLDSFVSIMRTRRVKPACGGRERRNSRLIKANASEGRGTRPGRRPHSAPLPGTRIIGPAAVLAATTVSALAIPDSSCPALESGSRFSKPGACLARVPRTMRGASSSKARAHSASGASAREALIRKITPWPCKAPFPRAALKRKHSRTRRRMRLRSAALPLLRGTTKAQRAGPWSPSLRKARAESRGWRSCIPRSQTRANSAVGRRSLRGNMVQGVWDGRYRPRPP